jgi:hypothetical protein
MPPLVVEIVFIEELFFDAQTEIGKFDSPRVITKSDPAEVSDAVLFAMNKEAVKMVIGPSKRDCRVRGRRCRRAPSPQN